MRVQSVSRSVVAAFVIMLLVGANLQLPATSAVAASTLSPAPVPTITGSAKVGSVLTAVPGTWGPAPVVLKYQWRADGVVVLGANSATLTLSSARLGKPMSVSVTGSKTGYTTVKKTSAATAAVTAVPVLSPAPVPTVTGSAKVGSVLTAVPGTWGPAPVVLKYQWRADGVVVLGANSATLTLSSARLGKTMSVSVTGSKTGYTSVKKTSASTAAVTAVPVLSPAPVPTITGSAKVGSVLTAVPGTWGPAPVVLKYQWRADGVVVLGANSATLTLSSARLGKTMSVSVTGSKTGYTSVKKTSAATAAVTAVPVLSPAPVPTITGSAKVGSVLTAVPGTWGPAPVVLKYQWRADGVVVLGANSATLTLSSARLGKTMSVSVTGSKTGYTSVKKTSAATAAVTAVPVLSPAPVPTITGSARVGSVLTAVPGTWGPAPVVLKYQWRADGVVVLGANSATLTLSSARLGKTMSVSVTGSKTGYTSVKKTSAATAAVAAAVPAVSPAPVPVITGTARVGSTLTAVPGTWGPAPVVLSYQWSANGVAIIGATKPTLTPNSTRAGKTLTVSVTGSKTGYTSVKKTSAATAAVTDLPVMITPIHVSGTITADASWSSTRTYIMDDSVLIAAGVTLSSRRDSGEVLGSHRPGGGWGFGRERDCRGAGGVYFAEG